MKVCVATKDFEKEVSELFNTDKVYTAEGSTDIKQADLLVFTGGEDVGLPYYLPQHDVERYRHLVFSNEARDRLEASAFETGFYESKKLTRILGICRGLQFLNVMLGGNLYPDLEIEGKSHDPIHPIVHTTENELSFMTLVNSLHHQAIRNIGGRGNGMLFNILAEEPTTKIPEIVLWASPRRNFEILGVQFHPELYNHRHPDKAQFADVVRKWVGGEKMCETLQEA